MLYASAALAGCGLLAVLLKERRKRSGTLQSNRSPTNFESYLQRHIDNPSLEERNSLSQHAPTSFEAYLRQAVPSPSLTGDGVMAESFEEEEENVPPPGAKVVTVLYGTEFGFSREVAETVCDELKSTGVFWPEVVDMAQHPNGLPLQHAQALLVVCSTQGDGVPPTEARGFCRWLLSDKAPSLEGVPFSVCALGDRSYTHFARCGKTIDARLAGLGAARFQSRVDVNKEDWNAINGWIESVLEGLHALEGQWLDKEEDGQRGVLTGMAKRAGQSGAETKNMDGYTKSRPYPATVVAVDGLCNVTDKVRDKRTMRIEIDLGDSGLTYLPGDALGVWPTNSVQAVEDILRCINADGNLLVKTPSWHYLDPYLSNATSSRGQLNQSSSITLRDALLRCYDLRQPKQALLRYLLERLEERATIRQGRATSANQPRHEALRTRAGAKKGHHLPNGATPMASGENKELRKDFLPNGVAQLNGYIAPNTQASHPENGNGHRHDFDVGGVHAFGSELNSNQGSSPRPLHEDICSNGCIIDAIDRLRTLLSNATSTSEYLQHRHVIDILEDFHQASLDMPPTKLLGGLQQLAPRLYSISSSPLDNPTRVVLTVAVVTYHANDRDRKGVCSTFLGERSVVGDVVPVYMYPNDDFRLPDSDDTPVVMVGPGTGVAPFRAFLMDRRLRSATASHAEAGKMADPAGVDSGKAMLFFGCRRSDQDFLYKDELEELNASGAVDLITAFSREGPRKVYVQDRLREQADAVWEIMNENKGHFYICGDGSSMASAVENALREIAASKLDGDNERADSWLDGLKARHRFQKDVW